MVGQRGLKQDRSSLLFMQVKKLETKLGGTRLFGEYRTVILHIYNTDLPHDIYFWSCHDLTSNDDSGTR